MNELRANAKSFQTSKASASAVQVSSTKDKKEKADGGFKLSGSFKPPGAAIDDRFDVPESRVCYISVKSQSSSSGILYPVYISVLNWQKLSSPVSAIYLCISVCIYVLILSSLLGLSHNSLRSRATKINHTLRLTHHPRFYNSPVFVALERSSCIC